MQQYKLQGIQLPETAVIPAACALAHCVLPLKRTYLTPADQHKVDTSAKLYARGCELKQLPGPVPGPQLLQHQQLLLGGAAASYC
jgi:hypothetical protein